MKNKNGIPIFKGSVTTPKIKVLKITPPSTDTRTTTLFMRQNGICYYCGKQCSIDDPHRFAKNFAATSDHIVPKSLGGSSSYSNLVMACNQCNNRKSDHTIDEFRRRYFNNQSFYLEANTNPNLPSLIEFEAYLFDESIPFDFTSESDKQNLAKILTAEMIYQIAPYMTKGLDIIKEHNQKNHDNFLKHKETTNKMFHLVEQLVHATNNPTRLRIAKQLAEFKKEWNGNETINLPDYPTQLRAKLTYIGSITPSLKIELENKRIIESLTQ